MNRPLTLEEQLWIVGLRPVGDAGDDVVPAAAAALDRLERHADVNQPIPVLHPQRLLPGEGDDDILGELVGDVGLDAGPLAEEMDEIFQRQLPAGEREPLEGVVDRRLVDLHREHRAVGGPRPRRVGCQLVVAGQSQSRHGDAILGLERNGGRLEPQLHQRPPCLGAKFFRGGEELRFDLLVDLPAGAGNDLVDHFPIGLGEMLVVLVAGDVPDERPHDRHAVEARLDIRQLRTRRRRASGLAESEARSSHAHRLADGERRRAA